MKRLLLLLVCAYPACAASGTDISFNFEVRPLLSDRCYACHGPDEKSRKAGLRLDQKESGYGKTKEGKPILVPGDPAGSVLWQRITAKSPKELMPPPESHLSLTPDEIALLKRWIESGAAYEPHWAFQPVGNPELPAVTQSNGCRNPIDRFVLARLEREHLAPAPEAPRETLIRRVSLDLTGLPPTPEEIDAFQADTSPDAFEKLVDRLLDSPRYGERMASDWLDLARFADTYGYQADVDRDMSAWRDWVIRALNSNLPYDQFLLWQLAGDLLENAPRDARLATAFNRLHRQTNEGGSIEEEFRTEYVADRVNTLGAAVMGVTLECARCHDHKYDPITQRDYYRFFAFFNNIDESGLYSHFTRATPGPAMLLYNEGGEERHAALKQDIAAAESNLAVVAAAERAKFDVWLATSPMIEVPKPAYAFEFDTVMSNATPDRVTGGTASLEDGPQLVEGHTGKALRFSGDNSVTCTGVTNVTRNDAFSVALWLKPGTQQKRAVVLHQSRAWSDAGSRGYELVLEEGRPTFALVHFWPGNAIAIRATETLPTNVWSQLTLTYDGSSRAAGLRLYRDGKPMAVEVVRDQLTRDIVHRPEWGDQEGNVVHLTLGARFRDSGFKDGAVDELQVFPVCLSAPEAAVVATGTNAPASAFARDDVFPHFLAHDSEAWRNAATGVQAKRREENTFVQRVKEIMVMQEMPQPRPTFLLKRGAYDAPGEAVTAGTPAALPPFPEGVPTNRLGLAQWLTSPSHPLTSRVAVNRLWQVHFGRGLVATPHDLGSQGDLPSHPELLDWLAHTFMTNGWDRKALHRLIVTSATYRQTSRADAAVEARDPSNRLLARGPRHRLSAEQVRDEALAVSGLLDPTLGGPSVKPYQPAGVWEESGTGKTYQQDTGSKLYRRSLYTFWRRTAPPPSMVAFDAPTREVCLAKRETTATPLQALVLLNDPQFVEASRVLGEELVRTQGNSDEALIRTAFRRVTGRQPEPREVGILQRLHRDELARFQASPDEAEKLLKVGDRPRDPALAAAPVAAATVLVNVLMNHDDFVMQR